MVGVIGTRELVTEGLVIVKEFGLKTYLRCVARVLKGERFTFLEMVMS